MTKNALAKRWQDFQSVFIAWGFDMVLKAVATFYTGRATLRVYAGDWMPTLLIEGALLGWWVRSDARAGVQSKERLLDALGLLALFGAVLVIGWEDTGWLALFPRVAFGLLLWRSVASALRDYSAYRAAQWYTAIQRDDKRAERRLDSERAKFRRDLLRQRARVEFAAGREALIALAPDYRKVAIARLRSEWLGVGVRDNGPLQDSVITRGNGAGDGLVQDDFLNVWLADPKASAGGGS